MKKLWLSVVFWCLTACCAAEDVEFRGKPTIVKDGKKVKIQFTLSRPTDVSVCIENAKREVVRHLVAGMLGPKPPAPLKPDSLAQSIAWDGNNDFGKPATGGPFKARVNAGLSARLPEDGESYHPSNDYRQYAAIFKFPPSGGRITTDPNGQYVGHCQYKSEPVTVHGALWMRRLGYIGSHGHELGCHCETTRFDLDNFGRLFVPDVFRFCVVVLDSAGNEITRFGSYGNMDSRGPDGPVPEPEIPFGWPLSVECAGGRVFVADLVNRRVVAVKFEHAASVEIPIE